MDNSIQGQVPPKLEDSHVHCGFALSSVVNDRVPADHLGLSQPSITPLQLPLSFRLTI